MDKIKNFYTKIDLLNLFLLVVFPIHIWSIYLIFNDVGWIAERTNSWDAVGYAGYSLTFALLESVGVFLLVALMVFLLPRQWKKNQRLAVISLLYLAAAFWAVAGQLYFILDKEAFWLFRILFNVNRFGSVTLPLFLLIVLATVVLPVIYIPRAKKFEKAVFAVADRLVILSAFFLFLDLIGIIIVIVRQF